MKTLPAHKRVTAGWIVLVIAWCSLLLTKGLTSRPTIEGASQERPTEVSEEKVLQDFAVLAGSGRSTYGSSASAALAERHASGLLSPILSRRGEGKWFETSAASIVEESIMNFTAPADPSISIELYASQRHPGLADFFSSSGTDNLSRCALVLTNLSTMDIVGLATRWIVTDRDVRQRMTKLSSDSFGDSVAARQAVIAAGTQLIATASGFKHVKVQPATGFVLGNHSRMFGWGRGQFVPLADLDGAQSVTAVVDSIIFADGRVIGPDELNLAGDINALSAAFKTVAQRLRDAISAGNLESVLRDFAATRSRLRRFDDDPAAFWTAMEAERMLRFPTRSIAARLQQLENFPSPPAFYR